METNSSIFGICKSAVLEKTKLVFFLKDTSDRAPLGDVPCSKSNGSVFMIAFSFETPRFAFRSPKRITITVPYAAFQKMVERSNEEGRSLSKLAAFLLEQGLKRG